MNNDLKIGNTGDDVKILEEKLKILGYYNGIITGSFGEALLEGVKAFQRDYDFEENGIITKKELDFINDLTDGVAPISIFPTLSYGSKGTEVGDLQDKLKTLLYYTGPINNNFDLETENAVKRFQVNNKLTADGIVGSKTWNLLNTLYGNLDPCVLDDKNDYITYKVVSGDTLWGIAKKYNTTVDEIKNLNKLSSNLLTIGQILKIPNYSSNYITYRVVSGDTLYSIAKKYNTSVSEIKKLNNLTSDILSIGQVLKIPESEQNYFNYIVKNKDTLYSIAKKYNTSVSEIKTLNNLTSDILSIGQVLKIPFN